MNELSKRYDWGELTDYDGRLELEAFRGFYHFMLTSQQPALLWDWQDIKSTAYLGKKKV